MDPNKKLSIWLVIIYSKNHPTFMLSVNNIKNLLNTPFFNLFQYRFIAITVSFIILKTLANKALKNLKLFKKNQSVLITGVSGSGKTENAKYIIDFLSKTQSDSQNVTAAGPIFEAFGNARTRGNSNSSRFSKLLEVSYFSSFTFHSHQIFFI